MEVPNLVPHPAEFNCCRVIRQHCYPVFIDNQAWIWPIIERQLVSVEELGVTATPRGRNPLEAGLFVPPV